MTDTLERRLRESLERHGGDIRPAPVAPAGLRRRVRRRQVGGVLAGVLALSVAAAGVVAGLQLVGPNDRGTPGGSEQLRSETVRGVTVSYPSAWYIEAADEGDETGPGRQAPVFALSNIEPKASLLSGDGHVHCTPTTVLVGVVEDGYQGPKPVDAGYPAWPVSMARDAAVPGDGCGEWWSARWSVATRTFQGTVRLGTESIAADRRAAFAAFSSLSFDAEPSATPASPEAASLQIGTGTSAGIYWSLTATPGDGGVTLELSFEGGSLSGAGFDASPSVQLLAHRFGPADALRGETVVFGVVPPGTQTVRLAGSTGDIIDAGTIVSLADLGVPFDAFFLPSSSPEGAVEVIDASESRLEPEPFSSGIQRASPDGPQEVCTESPGAGSCHGVAAASVLPSNGDEPVTPAHGGEYWGVYLTVTDDPADAERSRQKAVESGWPVLSGDLACDEGAAEQLPVRGSIRVAVYFPVEEEASARAFATREDAVGVARVRTYCLD
jgi:hypothetical protein